MSLDGKKYYSKLGDKSPIIIRLKGLFNLRRYLKTKNNRSPKFDAQLHATIAEYQIYWKLKQQDGFLNEEVYAHIGAHYFLIKRRK